MDDRKENVKYCLFCSFCGDMCRYILFSPVLSVFPAQPVLSTQIWLRLTLCSVDLSVAWLQHEVLLSSDCTLEDAAEHGQLHLGQMMPGSSPATLREGCFYSLLWRNRGCIYLCMLVHMWYLLLQAHWCVFQCHKWHWPLGMSTAGRASLPLCLCFCQVFLTSDAEFAQLGTRTLDTRQTGIRIGQKLIDTDMHSAHWWLYLCQPCCWNSQAVFRCRP